jgi:putative CocE/NonD family hydrolase
MNMIEVFSRGFAKLGKTGALAAIGICACLASAQVSANGAYVSPGPRYKVEVLPDVRVRMRDGVELAVRIIRPAGQGKFPAIMGYVPYRTLTGMKAARSEEKFATAQNIQYYMAQHGYVMVNYDSRGTGASGGVSTVMYEAAERQDGYDMVEWIAKQPWSNGNVGMWGISYGGVDTWQIAAMAPPHLKAVIVHSGTDDVYDDWMYPGGTVRSLFIFGGYAPQMAASNFAPPDPASSGAKWADIWEQHLKGNQPWSLGWLEHPVYGPYWKDRSLRPDYGRIKCAVFVIDGWADWYQTALLRAFSHLKGPKKALIGPWDHGWSENALPGPRIDARPIYLQWFDRFLKGIDTGVLKEPPVTIFVQKYQPPAPMYLKERGFYRQENEWPLARTQYTPMYLISDGVLGRNAEQGVPTAKDSYRYKPSLGMASGILGRGNIGPWAMPLDQRSDEAYSLTYTSKPLTSDLEITGDPRADIFVSSTADVAYFTVRLTDVAPDGTSKLLSRGELDATHRSSNSHPQPLTPGSVYELKIPMKSMAYIVSAGHRIRVDIASADFMNTWPVGKAAINSIVRGAQYPSRVILPVAPPQSPALPPPDFKPSPVPLPDQEEVPKPVYGVTYDLINQTATVTIDKTAPKGGGDSHTTFTVSDRDPANAVMKSVVDYVVHQPDGVIDVQAQSLLTSDKKVFRHIMDINITVDGKQHFSKSWIVTVPRVLN